LTSSLRKRQQLFIDSLRSKVMQKVVFFALIVILLFLVGCTRVGFSPVPESLCGNSELDGSEVCDGNFLAGRNCLDFNFSGGTLGCASNCKYFDISACSSTAPDAIDDQTSVDSDQNDSSLQNPCQDQCSGLKKAFVCSDATTRGYPPKTLHQCLDNEVCFDTSCAVPKTYTYDEDLHIFTKSDFSSPISCKLVCGGLCYNADYLNCVDNVAQQKIYSKSNSVYVEEIDPQTWYSKGSDSKKTFNLVNNFGIDLGLTMKFYFYPVSMIEYGQHSYNGEYLLITKDIFVKNSEKKAVDIQLPTEKATLNSLVQIIIDSNIGIGVSYPYYSQSFSIVDSLRPTFSCGTYIANRPYITESGGLENFDQMFICNPNVFVPLGRNGCTSDEDCIGKQCVANTCFNDDPNSASEHINLLAVGVYMSDNTSLNEHIQTGLNEQIGKLKTKILSLGKDLNKPIEIDTTAVRCSKSPPEIRTFLPALGDSDTAAFKSTILDFCDIADYNYTHTVIAVSTDGISQEDESLTTKNIMRNVVAAGVYLGDGVIVSQINLGQVINAEYTEYNEPRPFRLWPVLLHEMMHSFGSPDFYANDGVNARNYLLGDCKLMTNQPFTQDTPLCPIEAAYFTQKLTSILE